MNEITYRVIIDGVTIATGMSIEHATILLKALFSEYYNEPTMAVTIVREDRCDNCIELECENHGVVCPHYRADMKEADND